MKLGWFFSLQRRIWCKSQLWYWRALDRGEIRLEKVKSDLVSVTKTTRRSKKSEVVAVAGSGKD